MLIKESINHSTIISHRTIIHHTFPIVYYLFTSTQIKYSVFGCNSSHNQMLITHHLPFRTFLYTLGTFTMKPECCPPYLYNNNNNNTTSDWWLHVLCNKAPNAIAPRTPIAPYFMIPVISQGLSLWFWL